eukprot:COSAG03_NODE_3597_length_1929_cov_0.974863_1_plen_69_part_00
MAPDATGCVCVGLHVFLHGMVYPGHCYSSQTWTATMLLGDLVVQQTGGEGFSPLRARVFVLGRSVRLF